jgi:G3E family GTPase
MAVVSNEFGALGIDEALLGGGGQAFVELAGGCVCCQLSDELVDTLEALRARVDPDRIVIETSGVALPFETQLNLYRPPVNAWVGEDACLVVVNAAQLLEGDEIGETFETQVSNADLLLLHKVDLVDPGAIAGLIARLGEMNPDAPVLTGVHGNVDPELLFPTGPVARRERGAPVPHTHEGFTSEEIRVPAGLSEADALAFLDARKGLRTKGFVVTDAGPRIVQGVGRRLELVAPRNPDGTPMVVAPELLGRVVVIRRSQNRHTH